MRFLGVFAVNISELKNALHKTIYINNYTLLRIVSKQNVRHFEVETYMVQN